MGFWSSMIGRNLFTHGRKGGGNPYVNVDRYTIDISEFQFYDLCWYWENKADKTEGNIGIWIGFSYWVGSALCYWVLTEKLNIIARTTVQMLPDMKL